jgi:hypothetical protein
MAAVTFRPSADPVALFRKQARTIACLQADNAALRTRIATLEIEVVDLLAQLTDATHRAEQAEAQLRQPRVKPNTTEQPSKERKQRETPAMRPREAATREVRHEPAVCPHCGRPLTGKATEHHRRQVIDIPLTRYEVVDHIICSCHCGYCDQRVLAQPTAAEIGALPHSRISLGLIAYLTNLVISHRLPIDQVASFLERAHGLHLAAGEIVGLLHRVAEAGRDDLAQLLAEVQGAEYAHGDETGWRETGRNGYIWQLRTADTCYLTFEFSRGSQVPLALLDEVFTGVLVSDFYKGYSPLGCRKQRCWVHYLRDLKELQAQHPEAAAFVTAIRDLYREAQHLIGQPGYAAVPEPERAQHRLTFEARAVAVATPYTLHPEAPARVLAQRLLDYQSELFVFVECPLVPSENNAAERTFRPIVIARKICGGTRSEQGSLTKMTLLSLFVTWQLRGINPLQAIPRLLLGHSSLATAA